MSELNYIVSRLKIGYDLLKNLNQSELKELSAALEKKYLIDCNGTELGERILKYFLFYKNDFYDRMLLDDAINDGRVSDVQMIVNKIHRDNLRKESTVQKVFSNGTQL